MDVHTFEVWHKITSFLGWKWEGIRISIVAPNNCDTARTADELKKMARRLLSR